MYAVSTVITNRIAPSKISTDIFHSFFFRLALTSLTVIIRKISPAVIVSV